MPFLDHFGSIAPYYDRVIQPIDLEKLTSFGGLPIPGLLLDAGGGTGRVGQALVGMASQVVIADLSMRMLGQARSKTGLDLVCTYTERLPFQDGCFERVIMVDALHHVVNKRKSSQELWRVLKSGGRLIIVETDIRRLASKLVAFAEKLLLMNSHFLAPDRIADIFISENAACRVEEDGFSAWVIIDKR